MSTTSSETVQVTLPELGESVTEGVIVEWRKSEGEHVEAGEILLDLTTDKVDVEVPAPAAGVVTRILAQAGDAVEVGAVLAELVPGGGNGDAPSGDAQDAPPPPPPAGEPGRVVEIVLGEMESVTEGVVVEWRKAVGDAVARDEVLVEVSTDKVDLEVPAPTAGVLTSIAVEAGEEFQVTSPLGAMTEGAAPDGAAPAPSAAPAAPPAPAAEPTGLAPALEWPKVSPVARRMATHEGVDLTRVEGSGPGGIIRREDVVRAAAEGPAPEAPAGEEAVVLRGPAAALANYMDQSLTIPTATSFRTVPVGALDAQRRKINGDLKAAGREEKLSFTHLIAWAIIRATQAWPVMGTAYEVREGKPNKLVRAAVNLGLAVDVERKDGSRSLLVPVVADAGGLGFTGFRDAYDDKVKRTRFGGITPDELQGASVTLTNPGGLGTVASVPRLMPGQGTIVAAGAIGYPPGLASVPADTLAQLGVEKVVTLTSTYDHRVIQGAESGAFLAEIDRLLQGEDDFYADVRRDLGLDAAGAEIAAPVPAGIPAPGAVALPAAAPDEAMLDAVSGAVSVVKAFRTHGHLAADLDPLGSKPPGDPALNPANANLTPELMAKIPSSILRLKVPGDTFAEALPHLRAVYCGTIAYEVEHISDHEQRVWLRGAIESGEFYGESGSGFRHSWLPKEVRVEALRQLIAVDALERFLRRTYLGQKTFSGEGLDMLIPMMREVIDLSAAGGASEVVIGMAHRGRLATITEVVGRPRESIIAEFEGHMAFEGDPESEEGFHENAGDVKYHQGAEGTYKARSGRPITIKLAANPSHLEQVNAVVEGYTRARQTIRKGREPGHDPAGAVPLVIHGDAAFSGQGVVAETLNLSGLGGYTTGGTIHIIANNQIGFTTDPADTRSTQHPSDLARGFDIPIIHVNADDVDACIAAVRLAVAYRERYRRDVLIDLIGYRRLGHNELDEPAYTQPVMARTIKAHPPVSRIYADQLVEAGVVTREQVDAMVATAEQAMVAAHTAVTSRKDRGYDTEGLPNKPQPWTRTPIETSVSIGTLTSLNEQLVTVPDGFTLHPKLKPQLERRRVALEEDGSGITWAHAESLALATLLVEGIPVRLTGQDAERGTFSQRHLVLHDTDESGTYAPSTGRVYTPIANLLRAQATIEIHNSPLSEAACVGFEYGYSTQAPEALVLWEAQYGDFANGAQIMIDQFLVSGRAKWAERSRLTLLLPHGYEGNGPEHSSARLERFLQLAAEDNIRVANCSTAAQYFHLLRRQALSDKVRPLVVMTPKSLLRLRAASSALDELVNGLFEPVIADPAVEDPAAVRRLILCSGKIFHELEGHALRPEQRDLAIGRVELLYPFPEYELVELLATYPSLERVIWVQEEPRNMGAWDYMRRRRLLPALLPDGIELEYEGRPRRASSSEGYPQAHSHEQDRILESALLDTKGSE